MFTAVHKHFARLRVDGQKIRDEELKPILTNVYDAFRRHSAVNGIVTSDDGLKAMQFFCKHMIDSEV